MCFFKLIFTHMDLDISIISLYSMFSSYLMIERKNGGRLLRKITTN